MSGQEQSIKGGKSSFPFLSILTLIFVVAKLAGFFPHSWLLVFLPLWGPLAFVVVMFLLFILVALFLALAGSVLDEIEKSRKKKKDSDKWLS